MRSLLRRHGALFRSVAAAWILLVLAFPALPVRAAEPAPAEVSVGVFINDIQGVDLRTNSYLVDLYLWFRWTDADADPTVTIEIMNAFAPWDMKVTRLYETPQEMPDGTWYQAVRYQGQFNNELPLDRYPFDTQALTIEIEDSASTSSMLRFVPDPEGVAIDPAIRLPGYDLGAPSLTISDHGYATRFGDLRLSTAEPYSRATVIVPITRPPFANIVKILVPIFIVVLVAALTLLIRPDHIEARIGMGITALLTIVALQFTTSQELPQVTYLTMLDLLYIASFGFILVVMMRGVQASWRGDEDALRARIVRMDRVVVAGALAAYAISVTLIIAAFLL